MFNIKVLTNMMIDSAVDTFFQEVEKLLYTAILENLNKYIYHIKIPKELTNNLPNEMLSAIDKKINELLADKNDDLYAKERVNGDMIYSFKISK